MKIKNRQYSQAIGREDFFNRRKHENKSVPPDVQVRRQSDRCVYVWVEPKSS